MRVTRAAFERTVEKALAEIPEAFRGLLYNLEIAVKASPGAEAGRWKGSRSLLGLYKGMSRADMASPVSGSYLPARIILYQNNIQSLCADAEGLARRIRLTLRHEIAHHFGFSEDAIREKWPEGA